MALSGPGVRRGEAIYEETVYTSIAPTIVAYLGLKPWITPITPPLIHALEDEAIAAMRETFIALAENSLGMLDELCRYLGVEEPLEDIRRLSTALKNIAGDDDVEGFLKSYLEIYRGIGGVYRRIREARLALDAPINYVYGLAYLIPILAIAFFEARRVGRHVVVVVLPALAAAAAAFIAPALFGYVFTMSTVNVLSDYLRALLVAALICVATSILLLAAYFEASLRLGLSYAPDAIPHILAFYFLAMMLVLTLPTVWMLFSYGPFVKFPFPDWRLGYLYYTSVLTASFTLLLSWIVVVGVSLYLKARSRL
jgi:hypothetical protein